ncbi:MAG: type II toxin-antitoxin system VapC family toxin [Candidatus Sumerlaeia bacterium]
MNKANVIDASAILAYLQQEKGEDAVEAALDAGAAWISAVNACEVLGKLCEKGMPIEEAQGALDDLGLVVKNFDPESARIAAAMRVRTMPIGASLGDRACLALAQHAAQSGATPTVYTAEHAWAKLRWPFKIAVIRAKP